MRILLVLALLAATLAGCSGSDDGGEAAVEQPTVITDPRALDQSRVGEHVHDYWGGETEKVVIDHSLGSGWNNLGGTFAWTRSFVPADGVVIPQGTARLSITVDWTDQLPTNQYGEVSLWVKPANTTERRFVQAVERGDTVEVALAYEEADLPHQLLSAWEVTVQYNSSGSYNLFFGSTYVKMVAHRGLELQPFPAHPDQWNGTTALPLLDVNGTFENIGYLGSGDLPETFRPEEGALVPSDASYVEVTLTLAGSPTGKLRLSFHGADSRNFTVLAPEAEDNGVLRYTIAMEPGLADGPYGNASLWEFQIYTQNTQASDPEPYYYDGSYQLVATVHK